MARDRGMRVDGPLHRLVIVAPLLLLALLGACTGTPSHPVRSTARIGVTEDSELRAVSCRAMNWCEAVGFSVTNRSANSRAALVESYRGSAWSISPSPTLGPWSELFGVSCESISFCVAVGFWSPDGRGGDARSLVETYNGNSWAVSPSRNPGLSNQLWSVSCTKRSFCVGVGQENSSTGLVETWNGKVWSAQLSPVTAGGGDLLAVSCLSARSCIAAGSTGGSTLVETYDGRVWTILPSPNASTTFWTSLYGVSCTAGPSCVAVGAYYVSKAIGTMPVVETYDGTTWTITATPSLVSGGELNGVSCPIARNCKAVGVNYSGTDGHNLAETFDGSSWVIASTGNVGSQPGLSGVSCVASQWCMAVGSHYGGNSRYLTSVEILRGTTWSMLSSPNVTS